MLHAAGFAPAYRETDLQAPEMAQARNVLQHQLKAVEPFGAMVLDGAWNLLMSNQAAQRLTSMFAEDLPAVLRDGPPNLLRLLLHPKGVRHCVANWDEAAAYTLARAQREPHLEGSHSPLEAVLAQVLSYPCVGSKFRDIDLRETPPLLIPIHLRKDEIDLRLVTTVTTLGTAQVITLQELHIETLFPADEATERALRAASESK